MSTLKKIADVAKCSMSTVSRALNNCHDVSMETRQKILKIAKETGYFQRKKHIKQENRRKNEFNIAIICPEIQSNYYADMIAYISNELVKHGCRSIIYNFSFDQYELDRLLDICRDASNIDAIICLSYVKEAKLYKETPVVILGDDGSFYNIIENGIAECFESFKEQGYSRVSFVGESLTKIRERIFTSTAKEYPDIRISSYNANDRFEGAGREAGAYFLKKGELPDAIVCAYDEIALGMIEFFNENNVKVPDDVSVIGINDIPTAKYCFGGLSTVSYDLEAVCAEFIKDLIDDIKNDSVVARRYRVPSHFIKRNT